MPKISNSSYYPELEEKFDKNLLKKTTPEKKVNEKSCISKRISDLIEEDKQKLKGSVFYQSGRIW